MTNRTLDRRSSFDERSRRYPVRTLVQGKPLRSYTWSCRDVLDQGQEGACVGFGWAGELLARPSAVLGINDAVARRIYRHAQTLDEWFGEDYEGTSVLAGAKTVKQRGFMEEYRWAFSVNDVLLTLGYAGPVVFGFNWREGMWEPDDEGWIHASGESVGGHCLFGRAVNVTHRGILLQNSWGLEWGMNGCAHLSWADLALLMEDDGEACVPIGRDAIGSLT